MSRVWIAIPLLLALTNCGGGSSSSTKRIDISTYFPNKNMTKTYFKQASEGKNDVFKENIVVDKNRIIVKVDNKTTRTVNIEENNITINDIENDLLIVFKKEIAENEILYTLPESTVIENKEYQGVIFGQESIESKKECRLDSILERLDDYEINTYSGEILKFKCIKETNIVTTVNEDVPDFINLTDGEEKSDYDISYFYMQKNIGIIADINDDCIVEESEDIKKINDKLKNCIEEQYVRTFFIE